MEVQCSPTIIQTGRSAVSTEPSGSSEQFTDERMMCCTLYSHCPLGEVCRRWPACCSSADSCRGGLWTKTDFSNPVLLILKCSACFLYFMFVNFCSTTGSWRFSSFKPSLLGDVLVSRVGLFVSLQSLLLHGSLPEDEHDVSLDSGGAEQQLVTFGSFVHAGFFL